MTDQDLLKSFADRADVDSLDTFIHRYHDSLMRFISKYLGDQDVAHDVVQETFLQVAERPRKLIGVENCHNWLLRVARNRSIDHLRRKRTAHKHAEALAFQQARAKEDLEEETEPSRALERAETRERVQQEIASLKQSYRELLLLKVVEEKSYKEIAAITGLTTTNVGYLLHQAMKVLSERIEKKREELV